MLPAKSSFLGGQIISSTSAAVVAPLWLTLTNNGMILWQCTHKAELALVLKKQSGHSTNVFSIFLGMKSNT